MTGQWERRLGNKEWGMENENSSYLGNSIGVRLWFAVISISTLPPWLQLMSAREKKKISNGHIRCSTASYPRIYVTKPSNYLVVFLLLLYFIATWSRWWPGMAVQACLRGRNGGFEFLWLHVSFTEVVANLMTKYRTWDEVREARLAGSLIDPTMLTPDTTFVPLLLLAPITHSLLPNCDCWARSSVYVSERLENEDAAAQQLPIKWRYSVLYDFIDFNIDVVIIQVSGIETEKLRMPVAAKSTHVCIRMYAN